ncbi:MAG: amidohydrolase, partial [Spirochaetales bacterium]|nr:amidohydrolase [Spirochaetales bacterium]
ESSLEAQKVASRLLGSENVVTNRPISLGGDDFAEYIIKVPGVYGYVGSGGSKPETRLPLHNGKVELDEDCLVVAASLHVAYAINFLNGTIDRS